VRTVLISRLPILIAVDLRPTSLKPFVFIVLASASAGWHSTLLFASRVYLQKPILQPYWTLQSDQCVFSVPSLSNLTRTVSRLITSLQNFQSVPVTKLANTASLPATAPPTVDAATSSATATERRAPTTGRRAKGGRRTDREESFAGRGSVDVGGTIESAIRSGVAHAVREVIIFCGQIVSELLSLRIETD
jgi:hypothetical protein